MEKIVDSRAVDCIFNILQKCRRKDKTWLHALAKVFENCKIISRSDLQSIESLTDSGNLIEAFGSITNRATNNELKKKYFVKACKKGEFPCDQDVANVVEALATKEVTNGVYWLIQSWDDLLTKQQGVLEFAASKWPEFDWRAKCSGYEFWPVFLILHCLTSPESDKTDVYLEELKDTLSRYPQANPDENFDSGSFEKVTAADATEAKGVSTDAETNMLRDDVTFVLRLYMEENRDEIVKFLGLLKFRGLITSEKEKELLVQFPIEDDPGQFATSIMNAIIVSNPESWKEKLAILKETDTDFCKELLSIIDLLIMRGLTNSDVHWLFHSWDRLKSVGDKLHVFIEATWPTEYKHFTDKWPWNMMEMVMQNQTDGRVRVFVERFKCMDIQQKQAAAPPAPVDLEPENLEDMAKTKIDSIGVEAGGTGNSDPAPQDQPQVRQAIAWMEESHLLLEKIEEKNLMTLRRQWKQFDTFIEEKNWAKLEDALKKVDKAEVVTTFVADIRNMCLMKEAPVAHSTPIPTKRKNKEGKQNLSTQQVNLPETTAAQNDLASLKEWVKKSQQEIGNAYTELKELAVSTWPGDSSIGSQNNWPFLLMARCINENDMDILSKFVLPAQQALQKVEISHPQEANIPVRELSAASDPPMKEDEEQNLQKNELWLEDSFDNLSESFHELKDVVSSIWPSDEELNDEESWPMSLTSVFTDPTQEASVKEFIHTVEKLREPISEEEDEAVVQQKLKENRQWIKNNFRRFKTKPDVVKPLLKTVWPTDKALYGERWAFNVLKKCQSGTAKEVNTFVENLKKQLEEKVVETPKEEKPKKKNPVVEKPKEIQPQEDENARLELDKNIKWLKASFSVLKKEAESIHPLLQAAWPEDEKLYGKDWASELLSKCESGKPEEVNTVLTQIWPILEERKRVQENAQDESSRAEEHAGTPKISPTASGVEKNVRDSAVWMRESLQAIVESYEIVLPVLKEIYPNDESPSGKDRLKEMLLEKMSEGSPQTQELAFRLKELIHVTKSIFGEGAPTEQIVTPVEQAVETIAIQDTTAAGEKASYRIWLKSNRQTIAGMRSEVLPIVEELWSKEQWMSDVNSWPDKLFLKIDLERDERLLAQLVAKFKSVLLKQDRLKTDQGGSSVDAKEITELTPAEQVQENIEWLQRSTKDLKFFERNLEPIITEMWPRRRNLITGDLWPIELATHCKRLKENQPKEITVFLSKIRSMVELLKKQFQGHEDAIVAPQVGEEIKRDCVLIEFRALLSENTFKPRGTVRVWTKTGDLIEVRRMRYDDERNCYTISLLIHKDWEELQYKYLCDDSYGQTWEKIIGDDYNNRTCYFYDKDVIESQRLIVYDIVTFNAQHVKVSQAQRHLPNPIKQETADMINEIHFWVRQMKRGWVTVRGTMESLQDWQFEKSLHKWLEEVAKNKGDVYKVFVVALSLIDSLRVHQHQIRDKSLLQCILKLLSTETLDKTKHEELYRKVVNILIGSSVRPKSDIPESILLLFQELEKIADVEFIFALPIYWLIVNGGELKYDLPENAGNLYFTKRSCLPSGKQLQWGSVKRKFEDNFEQNALKNMADRVHGVCSIHPWIVKAYEYMLTPTTTLELIGRNHALSNEFSIEKVLISIKRRIGYQSMELRNFDKWINHISRNLELMRQSEDRFARSNLDIEFLSQQILEILKTCENFDRQTERDNKTVIFALQIARELIVTSSNAYEQWGSNLGMKPEFFISIKDFVRRRFEKSPMTKDQMKHWDELHSLEWSEKASTEQWKAMIAKSSRSRLAEEWRGRDEEFVRFFAELLENFKFDDKLDEIFRSKVEECFKVLLLSRGKLETGWGIELFLSRLPFAAPKKSILQLYDDFVSRQVQSQPPMEFMLEWPHTLDFFRAYYKKEFKGLSDRTKTYITTNIKVFSAIVDDMISGQIIIEQLLAILDNQKQCIDLCRLLFKDKKKEIWPVINARQDQMTAYETQKNSIMTFQTACQYLAEANVSVSLGELMEKHDQDISRMRLPEVVECKENENGGAHKVILFENITSHMDELHEIALLKNNIIFLRFWRREIENVKVGWQHSPGDGKIEIDWEIVVKDLWKIVRSSLLEVSSGISSGEMELTLLHELFNGCDETQVVSLMNELSKFHDLCTKSHDQSVASKMNTVLGIAHLKTALDIALSLQELRTKNGLESHIPELEGLSRKGQESLALHDVEALRLPKSFDKFTREDANILSDFLSQDELLSWLLENTKRVDDVQVLCDLAMISAGENQIELDRVSALNTTVPALSPLIFDLNEDITLDELLKRCRHVFEKCRQDKALLPKWKSVGANIQWIKQTETFYGSVGKQSMAQVVEINERGIYTIQQTVERNPAIDNSLSLKILKQHDGKDVGDGTDEDSQMSLADLHDLQSKLMLIAGEKESAKHVTVFVDVLNAMETLALSFVNLVNAGCMLFNQWKMEVANQMSEGEQEFLVKVFFLKNCEPISAKCKFEQIESVTAIMSDILQRWMKQLNADRMKYYYLNEYSIHQIIYLCKTLANERETKYPDQVYMLLSRIKRSSTFADIKEILSDATKVTDSDEEEFSVSDNEGGVEELRKIDLMKKMARALVNEDGIEQSVAKAAVQAKGYRDKDECIDWILLNYDSKNKIDELCQKFDEEIGFSHRDDEVHAYGSVVHDRSHRTIREVMTILQREAISSGGEAMSSSILTVYTKYSHHTASLTLQDCLSVKHLGKFLTMLGSRKDPDSKAHRDPRRSLPPPLKKHRPNLIICPEEEMLSVVLSLYMHNQKEPLPGASEVLVCHENTSSNEVERFFRRAMGKCDSNGSPLFCLAFAHMLTHNVAEAAERIFDSLSNEDNINPDYQLAVLTNSQQHYLTTCFDQYLADVKVLESNDTKISAYLRKHLSVNVREARRSAACVEKQSSTVKVVFSKRSGVGKTLHVKRLKQHLQSRMGKDTNYHITTVRFMQADLDVDLFIDTLYQEGRSVLNADTHLIHIDLTPAVKTGVDRFTFNLLILGSIEDTHGRVWRKHFNHLYAVEVTEFRSQKLQSGYAQSILPLLPKVCCLSPQEECKLEDRDKDVVGMDDAELESDTFQRPFQYLLRYSANETLDDYNYDEKNINLDKNQCIATFKKYLSIPDPSWAQIHYFARFLNFQLQNCEKSIFCNTAAAPELRGLKAFAIQLMIVMAQDFATPSLKIADESSADDSHEYLAGYQRRRKWEETSHPYIFFNDDGVSMTFINVDIDAQGILIGENKRIILHDIMATKDLVPNLKAQGVPIGVDFDELTRKEKLKEICKFMGIPFTEGSVRQELMFIVENQIDANGCVLYKDENEEAQVTRTVQVVSPGDMHILLKIKNSESAVMGAKFEEKERVIKQIALKLGKGDSFTETIVPDPDPTYELTTDNVLKIFAIYMRFRCGIPVIIMGETGCGKTRMIEFISSLKKVTDGYETGNGAAASAISESGAEDQRIRLDVEDQELKNMITLKVHGGVTVKDIQESIHDARKLAEQNIAHTHTILFYDEANTTEAIYAIKEAVCDLEVNGHSFSDSHLQIVAACNPYKKLSEKAIDKLEKSGLGYRVRKNKAEDKFGSIPMRTLVYRVVPLPPSMRPFVWDFGQLGRDTEKIYIEQMTKKLCSKLDLPLIYQQSICNVLSDVQSYMRDEADESRYVSLRDVERCMKAYEWFYTKRDWLYPKIEEKHKSKLHDNSGCRDMEPNSRTLIQILGLCYHASLDDRGSFREKVSRALNKFCSSRLTASDILKEFHACQAVIVSDMKKEKYVALNEALMENVFMMTLCVDMKIPLFLIGKPGSSKSMAKTLVSENMRGDNSQGKIFRKLKQVQVVSFQCSTLTHASGIIGVFKQCVKLQAGHGQGTFAAAVVLDEIGLAEDSPNMPLKVLHPLLESGTTTYERLGKTDDASKVAFVGISNWSLDPAKMNRGVFVTRNKPNKQDMEKTTEAIFSDNIAIYRSNKRIIDALLKTCLNIYEKQENEYFGLRDFYSLMKMIKHTGGDELTMQSVMEAVVRNFSGGEYSYTDQFHQAMKNTRTFRENDYNGLTIPEAIDDNLSSESRYLLLLANQYAAINLLKVVNKNDMQVIFGSSFPGDRNYTEICRNINRIKICMETGNGVVILNLAEIHESLYDALNQHYVMFGDQKYVDLALGEHRVKCRVHNDFRMIILENKDVVYHEYPAPLINRLEKHHFDSKSLLLHGQKESVEELAKWIDEFCTYGPESVRFEPSDCFVGFHEDTISSVVLVSDHKKRDEQMQMHYRNAMLQTATMDSIFRLQISELSKDKRETQNYYLNGQEHDTLAEFLVKTLNNSSREVRLYELVSFSNVLSEQDRKDLECRLKVEKNSIMLLSLQQFDTEQQYLRKLNDFFRLCKKKSSTFVLLIQCSQAEKHRQLIACARFGLTNAIAQYNNGNDNDGVKVQAKSKVIAAFLLSTGRRCGETNQAKKELLLQHTTDAEIVYVDELRPSMGQIKSPRLFFGLSLKHVFEKCLGGENLLNIQMLFKECVCDAVQKLNSNNEERNLARVGILTKIFDEDEVPRSILGRICHMYSERGNDETDTEDSSWSVDEACNVKSLIEGGTFRKTLWMCLKRHVAKYLAYILSIVDSNDNLDILHNAILNQVEWQKDLWLKVLDHVPFLLETAENDEAFQVQNSNAVSYYKFGTPFISYLHQLLSEKLRAVVETFEKGSAKKIQIFLKSVDQIRRTMCTVSSEAGDGFLVTFLSDVIHLVYKPGTNEKEKEVEAVINVTKSFIKERMQNMMIGLEEGNQPALIYYIIHEISPYLEHLAYMFSIDPTLIDKTEKWRTKQEGIDDFRIHEFAFGDLLDVLKLKSQSITDATICLNWHKTVSLTIDLYNNILESSAEKRKEALQKKWIPISFLNLLLNKLMPDKEQTEYIEVIAKQANLLSKGCRQRSLQSLTFARLLCNTLSMCLEELELKLTLRWQDSICKTCNTKIVSPMLLPCGHVLCLKCLQIGLASDDSTCPTCAERIPKNKKVEELLLSEKGKREVNVFKQNCTILLLTFVDQFLFEDFRVVDKKSQEDEEEDVSVLLLEGCVSRPHKIQRLKTAAFDLNINARSLILERLLQHSDGDLDDKLDCEIREADNQGQDENLSLVVLNHFESALTEIDWDAEKFLEEFNKIRSRTVCDLDMFRDAAILRKMLQDLAAILYDDNDLEGIIPESLRCLDEDQSETFKLYLVKTGCFTYGTEWFNKVSRRLPSKEVFPACLRKTESLDIDPWAMLGDQYTAKSAELVTMSNENIEKLFEELISHLHADRGIPPLTDLLAVASWILKEQDLTARVVVILKRSPKTQLAASLQSIFEIVNKITGSVPHKTVCNLAKVMIMVAGAIYSGSCLMPDFVSFLDNPSKIKSLFLPSMPESTFFKVPEMFRKEKKNVLNEYWTDMYTCPNGHIYTIGDCTHPVWKANCNECGAEIGGENYEPAAGNKRFVLEEGSQAGYLLEETDPPRQNMDDPNDRMTKQGVAVTRFMLHTCMLIAVHRNHDLVRCFSISPNHTAKSLTTYLFGELQNNLQHLRDSLALNMDDTVVVINKIFEQIIRQHDEHCQDDLDQMTTANSDVIDDDSRIESSLGSSSDDESGSEDNTDTDDMEQFADDENAESETGDEDIGAIGLDMNADSQTADVDPQAQPCDWSSVDARRKWEQKFRGIHLVPVFTNIRDHLDNAWKAINESGNLCEMALYRIMHDMPLQNQLEQNGDTWSKPSFWKTIRHPSLAQLTQAIRDDPGKHEILQLVLQSPHLHVIKLLKVVVEVQEKFIEKYQYKKDLVEVDEITFTDYLNTEHNRQKAGLLLDQYFKAWNQSGFSVKLDGCHREINKNSPISMALPSNRGHGKWAKLLTESLIKMQNEFLHKCSEKSPGMRFQQVKTSELLAHHLVTLDRESDLMPLINMHTNYYIIEDDVNGNQHHIAYNLGALEKQVKERFIMGKKLIDIKSIRCIQYPQDIGIGTDWAKLNLKIPQLPLTQKMKMNVDTSVRNQTQAEVCEAVRIVAIAISFLSKVKPEHDLGLKHYLTNDLFLTDGHSSVVHKTIEFCHTLDLYQRLTWHKAVMFSRQGIDPYKDVFAEGQQEVPDEKLQEQVLTAFAETNVKLLQQRINEILQKRPDYNLNWSLSEDIFPYIEDFLDENVTSDSWYKHIPIEVCYKHVTHLFKLTVQYMDEKENEE